MNKTKHFGKRALIILLPMFFVIIGAIILIGTHKEDNEKKEDIIEEKEDVDDIVLEVREKINNNEELNVIPIEYYSNKEIFNDIQVENETNQGIKYIGYTESTDSFEDFKEENRNNYDCIIKVEDKSVTNNNSSFRTDNISKTRKVYIRNSEGQLVEYKGDE